MASFLRNCWYVAAASEEVGQKPFRRILLGAPVVLYRPSAGKPVALFDRCPHRLVPLSLGRLTGDNLQCLYHGLEFDAAGVCVHNPHDKITSSKVRVDRYPLAERYGYVWIWMGDAAKADPGLIPSIPFLEDETRFRAVRGRLKVAANYELITDNLLDLSHVEFLHPMFRRAEGIGGHRTEFLQEGDAVIANRWKPDTTLNDFARLFWDRPEDRGDGRANMRWEPPSTLLFDLGACEVGGRPENGVCTPAAHLLTPETERSTHYFWAQARNRRLVDPELDEQLWRVTNRVFEEEDKLVIEAQQVEMGDEADLMKLKPLLLKSDAPAVMARRILSRRIAEESSSRGGQ